MDGDVVRGLVLLIVDGRGKQNAEVGSHWIGLDRGELE